MDLPKKPFPKFLASLFTYVCCKQGVKKYPQGISASMPVRNIIPMASPMFSGSSNPTEILGMLCDQTGSGKSKMTTPQEVEKREMHIYRLVCEIETKFKRLIQHLLGPAIQRKYFEYCTTKPEMENPKWRPLSLENNRKHVYY